MTKYLLHSGGLRSKGDHGKKFFAEMLEGLGQNPKVLIVIFAVERETWEERFDRFTKHFLEYIPNGITPELSLADTNTFTTQVHESDTVFFYGGDAEVLRLRLEQYNNLVTLFDGKVIAGTSAGSAVFCSEYWGYSTRRPAPGLGIFPIKFMPHCYAELPDPGIRGPVDWERAKEELRQSGNPDQKIYDLREGEYVMLEL